ncbi:unnamed protein product, partial [Discosporangium mesarthrocarpum]
WEEGEGIGGGAGVVPFFEGEVEARRLSGSHHSWASEGEGDRLTATTNPSPHSLTIVPSPWMGGEVYEGPGSKPNDRKRHVLMRGRSPD